MHKYQQEIQKIYDKLMDGHRLIFKSTSNGRTLYRLNKCCICNTEFVHISYEDEYFKIECKCKNKVFGETLKEVIDEWNIGKIQLPWEYRERKLSRLEEK